MARPTINDFSETPSENTDVGGVGIQGSNKPSNLDDAFRSWLAIWAAFVEGTVAILSSVRIKDETDGTKTFKFNVENVPTATNRTLDVEALRRNGSWVETVYTSSDTHEFLPESKFFQLWGSGSGAGGGGVDGQGAGFKAAGSGGSSGFFAHTDVLAIGSIEEGAITIGAGGNGGSGAFSSNDGQDGNPTEWDDGTNEFTWGGGKKGLGARGDSGSAGISTFPGRPGGSAGLNGSADCYTVGFATSQTNWSSATPHAYGGQGGNSPYGQGGVGGDLSNGGNASGYGAGGGGAAVHETTTNYSGGDGTGGILIVREW